MRYDHDRQVSAQLVQQLLDVLGRQRIARAGGLIEQEYVRLVREYRRRQAARRWPEGQAAASW